MTTLDVARAEALFVSVLDPAEPLDGARVREAVRVELTVGDVPARMAQLYGEHEVLSARRMRWALKTVADVYAYSPA